MRLRVARAALWLLPLFSGVAKAIECVNVTIADANDAAAVRSDCSIITGNLGFAKDVNESINLDGVEEIQGDITHSGCEESWDDCTIPSDFSISSSTLATVGGNIEFWYFQGLKELRFPKLARVQGSVSLKRLHQLTRLDITKLAHLGYFTIEANNLTSLQHEGLEGFTGENKYGSVSFLGAAVKSVDSFFSYPIRANGSADQSRVTISKDYLPNVDHIAFGWALVPELWISGDDISVTLGTSESSDMELKSIMLKGNITKLERNKSVENLTVGSFTMEKDGAIEELSLPFDQLSSLAVRNSDGLQTIKLPKSAVNWEDFSLEISSCASLNLTSQYVDDEQVWYWPEKNISRISISRVNISNEFFDSFLDNHADGNNSQKVLNEFTISPNPLQETAFNCTPFDELEDRGVLVDDYSCSNVTESAAAMTTADYGIWPFASALLAIAFCL
ncbi:hypothetical protein AK830_g801 [Neonectria ditissima]|uniref:Protein ecm33 n=1 Tax=Neonectria ditissima TaxID=78410 RepID=A0A0P7B6W6_9HYPO|nr:hypothetical protein AK830_g801 [Neonectria ditissima]